MLKHEDNPQMPSPSAAEVRVTPEELAAAVTALQIRKEGQPGTIAIGDAVEELGLDVTPEEVLAEVQARRQAAPQRTRRRGQSFVLALGIAGVLLGLAVERNGLLQMRGRQAITLDTAEGSMALNQVSNEQQVYVNSHGLQQLIAGEKPEQVQVYPDYKSLRWGIIKHGGKSYMQGYTLQTRAELLSQPIALENCVDHYGPTRIGSALGGEFIPALKVTLPVDGLYHTDFMQTPQESLVGTSGVRSDSHLGDYFTDRFVK